MMYPPIGIRLRSWLADVQRWLRRMQDTRDPLLERALRDWHRLSAFGRAQALEHGLQLARIAFVRVRGQHFEFEYGQLTFDSTAR